MSFEDQARDMVFERALQPLSDLSVASLGILAEAIPARELLPARHLTDLLAHDDYRLYAYHSNAEVWACALIYLPTGSDFAWLDYMAVRSDMRGRRIGSKLFWEIAGVASAERPAAQWFFLEVDDDREGSEETLQANRKRIRFYQRLGAQLISNVPYRFPSPTGKAVPMRLMAYQLRRGARLSPENVRRAIEGIFSGIHGRSMSDPLLAWIVGRMPSALDLE